MRLSTPGSLVFEFKVVTASDHKVGVINLQNPEASLAKIIGTQEGNNIYVQCLHAQFSSSANVNSKSTYAK